MEKDLRDQKILDLHNEGNSIRDIAKEMKIGKSTVSNVLNSVLIKDKVAPKKVVEVELTGKEERFNSFVGYERLNVNEYVHKDSGEVVRVVYVKAKSPDEFGYFVKLSDEKKIDQQVGSVEDDAVK